MKKRNENGHFFFNGKFAEKRGIFVQLKSSTHVELVISI